MRVWERWRIKVRAHQIVVVHPHREPHILNLNNYLSFISVSSLLRSLSMRNSVTTASAIYTQISKSALLVLKSFVWLGDNDQAPHQSAAKANLGADDMIKRLVLSYCHPSILGHNNYFAHDAVVKKLPKAQKPEGFVCSVILLTGTMKGGGGLRDKRNRGVIYGWKTWKREFTLTVTLYLCQSNLLKNWCNEAKGFLWFAMFWRSNFGKIKSLIQFTKDREINLLWTWVLEGVG